MSQTREVKYYDNVGRANYGVFHQWGTEEFPTDKGDYFPVTRGIIEDSGGKILLVKPENITFVHTDRNTEARKIVGQQ